CHDQRAATGNALAWIWRLTALYPLHKRVKRRREIKIGLIDGPILLSHPDLATENIREVRGNFCTACSQLSAVRDGRHAPRHPPSRPYLPRSASVVGLAKRGVIPRKQFYIKLFFLNTVILGRTYGANGASLDPTRHYSPVYAQSLLDLKKSAS